MTRVLRSLAVLLLPAALLPALTTEGPAAARPAHTVRATYHNPLRAKVPGGGTVDSCADPTVVRGRAAERRSWFMYCTTDPLNDSDTAAGPEHTTFHPVPMLRSRDLTHWRYVGDALPQKPSWAASDAAMWAPDVVWSRTYHRYYMTFVVTDTADSVSGEPGCTGDSAIGVATSRSAVGPWHVTDQPLVAPRRGGTGCNFLWTYDPDVLGSSLARRSVLYFGSYYGGVFAQRVRLTAAGMSTTGARRQVAVGRRTRPAVAPSARMPRSEALAAEQQRVSIANRYEGTNVVRHGRWYYMFASATNCCNGPLTGYSVFAGRSRSPLGPFKDREGNSFLAGRVGGTPVISMNGNRWVGTGHSSAFVDRGGQWWLAYHAVDRGDPYFAGQPGFTKRPVLLDPLDWLHGWPTVRAGRWASDKAMAAPAAQPGERTAYRPRPLRPDRHGRLLKQYSDGFGGSTLAPRWSWVRPPADTTTYGVAGGRFRFDTQAGDLSNDTNNASVLTEQAPSGDYVVQTKVRLDLPPEGCCYNYVQAGLVVYGSDDSFVKLAHVSIYETRQTEFATEVPTVPTGYPRYGNTVIGPPGDVTWLRIVRHRDRFTGYTSQGGRWVRGGTWVNHTVGPDARIGLVSMGGTGFTAHFDNVRVWRLRRPAG